MEQDCVSASPNVAVSGQDRAVLERIAQASARHDRSERVASRRFSPMTSLERVSLYRGGDDLVSDLRRARVLLRPDPAPWKGRGLDVPTRGSAARPPSSARDCREHHGVE